MTSKTSFPKRCSEFAKIYLWSLKRNAGMGGILAALMFVGLPMVLAMRSGTDFLNYEQVLLSGVGLTLVLLFAVLLCVRMFGFLQNSRGVDLFHALPVGRVPMLLGNWCAGMTLLLLPVLVNFGIVLGVSCTVGCNVQTAGLLRWNFGWFALFGAAALSCCILFITCSGSVMDALLSLVGVSIGWPLMVYCADYFATRCIPGMNPITDSYFAVQTLFSPFAAGYPPTISGGAGWGGKECFRFLLWWIFFTAAMLAGACFFYARRKSEAAEDRMAYRGPKTLIRFLVTVSAGLAFGFFGFHILREDYRQMIFFTAAGSLLVHTAVETIYARGFRTLKRSLRGYAVEFACLAAFFGITATGCFGYDTYVPQASEVKSVTVSKKTSRVLSAYDAVSIKVSGQRETLTFAPVLEDREEIAAVLQAHREITACLREYCYPYQPNTGVNSFSLTYLLYSGKTVKRTYFGPDARDAATQKAADEKWLQARYEIENLSGYLTCSSILYFLEPDTVLSVESLETPSKSDKMITYESLPDELKLRLLQALKEDDSAQSRNPNYQDKASYGYLSIEYGGFYPTDTMRKALGVDVEQVFRNSCSFYYLPGGEVDRVMQEIAATEK